MGNDHEQNIALRVMFGQDPKPEVSKDRKQRWINFKSTDKEANMNLVTLQTYPELKHLKFRLYKEKNMNRPLNHNVKPMFHFKELDSMTNEQLIMFKIGLTLNPEEIQKETHAPPGFIEDLKRKIDERLGVEPDIPPEPIPHDHTPQTTTPDQQPQTTDQTQSQK
jgi:hypothetical protein